MTNTTTSNEWISLSTLTGNGIPGMHVFNDYWIAEKLSSLSLLSHTSASWSLLLKNVVVEKDRIWPMAITFAVIKCVQCYCCSHCVCSTTLLWNVAKYSIHTWPYRLYGWNETTFLHEFCQECPNPSSCSADMIHIRWEICFPIQCSMLSSLLLSLGNTYMSLLQNTNENGFQ